MNTKILVCPACHIGLESSTDLLKCKNCSVQYERGTDGFFNFFPVSETIDNSVTTEDYAHEQDKNADRVWASFLGPLLKDESSGSKMLDLGCGVGALARSALNDGHDATGVDLPSLTTYWKANGNSPDDFFAAAAARLPFPDDSYDVVWSLGVIEHIGTITGHCTLAEDYQAARINYVNEILRVTKPGGRIIIGCPNKRFPVDIQHGPLDSMSRSGPITKLRARIYDRTGMNFHRIIGKYQLVSFGEVRRLFVKNGNASSIESLPLNGYFAFGRFGSGFLSYFARLAEYYVNNIPRPLLSSPFNPYVMVVIRK